MVSNPPGAAGLAFLLEEFGLVEVKPRAGIRVVYSEVTFIRENYQFRSLIELHQGRITIDSVVGKGTQVRVFLPPVRVLRPERVAT